MENVILLVPLIGVIVVVAGVILKKSLDGERLLRRKSREFLRD